MADVKQPRFVAPDHRTAHSLRDFQRGFQTKNMVKGAAGGARGVDFQDHEAEFMDRVKDGKAAAVGGAGGGSGAGAESRAEVLAQQVAAAQAQSSDTSAVVPTDVVQPQFVQRQDKVEVKEDPKKRKFTGSEQRKEEDQPDESQLEELFDSVPTGAAEREHLQKVIERLLQDPMHERRAFGALFLTQPEDIKRVMGTPVRAAKHLLMLASRMVAHQRPREEVVNYLAETFIAFGHEFGRRAFKDFSVNVGIGSVYPLEVRERCVAINEDFLPTTTRVRFTSSKRWLQGKIKETLVLEYPEELVITEFAVKGGTRPGYQLVPMKQKGKHGLRFFVPGEYLVLLLCQDALGFERLEQVKVTVEGVVDQPKSAVAPRKFSWTPRKPPPTST
jgi:hypothetical protein